MRHLKKFGTVLVTTVCAIALGTAGCSDDGGGAEQSAGGTDHDAGSAADSAGGAGGTPTYHAQIAPMIDKHCGACHVAGGIGPFELDTYEKLSQFASIARGSIESRSMPPWMPDPSCRTFEDERHMTEAEIAAFGAWIDAGKPEGDLADAPADSGDATPTFNATHSLRSAEAYTPPEGLIDDYRCFVLDGTFDETMYMVGSRVLPDAGPQVHHVLVYAVDAAEVPSVLDADAKEDGPGYTCFGGPLPSGGGLPNQIGAWVPGILPDLAQEGEAVQISAGSRIVMQIHYNSVGVELAPDRTTFEMILTDDPPQKLLTTRPLAHLGIQIPAGEHDSVQVRKFSHHGKEPMVISTVTGHMHLLGKSISATVLRSDGTEECLLDIPNWDFDWQQSYGLKPEDYVVIQPGEAIELTCVYDNSEANQPIIDGARIAPQAVTWGEGTFDEMCLLYIKTVEDFVPPPPADAPCQPYADCLSACDAQDSACVMGCASGQNNGCFQCTIQALTKSGCATSCGGSLLPMTDCLQECGYSIVALGSDATACFEATCPNAWATLQTCLDPLLTSGACDDGLEAACEMSLTP